MADARSLDQIRLELIALHGEACTLMAQAHHLRPSARLLIFRKPLAGLEERLDQHFQAFVGLDADLIRHANAPSDINAALRNSAQFSFHTAVRDSVRGLLGDAAGAVGAIRTRLDFIGSLILSVVALLIAVVALLLDAAG